MSNFGFRSARGEPYDAASAKRVPLWAPAGLLAAAEDTQAWPKPCGLYVVVDHGPAAGSCIIRCAA